MSSEDMGLVPSQRLENGLNSHLVFQDDALRFNCGAPAAQRRVGGVGGGEVPKTRDLSGFIDERFFAPPQSAADFRRSIYGGGRDRRDPPEARTWSGNGAAATPSVDGSEDDEDEDEEEDDVEDDDDEVADEGLVGGDGSSKGNNSNNGSNGEGKIGNGKQKHHNQNQSHHHHHHFGVNMMVGSSSRDVIVKESGIVQQTAKESPHRHNHQLGRLGSYHQNAVTVAENDGGGGDAYYSQYFQGPEGLSAATGPKDLGVENGCGFSGRKDSSYSNDSGESLRTILSDPVTGAFMDDAVILPCGHSFGSGGIQHVIRMKSCYTCSQSISEDSIAPNLSLRDAVQAFRREEELQFQRSSKRKRERLDQDKGIYGDSGLMELPRGRGVQFPFAVTDRVIIKGNKRTPQRFVGREAVVTTQCLNGWYVVKTLDNAESVKLQYRSLAKVPDDPLSKPMSSKMAPNWL